MKLTTDSEPSTDTVESTADSLGLSTDALEEFETVERTIEICCASGDRSIAVWRGVPVKTIVETMEVPADTTHLIVASGDGYRACLNIRTALDSMLAITRNGQPITDTDSPRLVGPGIDGIRTVKGVSRIKPVVLPSTADPEEYEKIELEE